MVYQLDTPGLEDQAVTTEKIDTAAVTLSQAAASLTNALVPVKGIIMFSGTAAEVPANWSLCNGTPDLRNKFVIAAQAYDAATDARWETNITGADTATGGSKDAIVVDHQHTTTVTDDGHSHGITQSNHTHSYGDDTNQGTGGGQGGGGADTGSRGQGKTTGGASANITINDATTGITVDVAAAGSSGTNANLPPYFALAFIMRVT
jgi:hypothetical protein